MDKTLADYIKRTQENLNKQSKTENDYPVYPEKQHQDSDEKINPYSKS
jgi:hypothetical protein